VILTQLAKTPRAQRRSKAFILLAYMVTLLILCANAVIRATPTSGPAWASLGVAVLASVVTWALVR